MPEHAKPDKHPTPDELLNYHARNVPREQRDWIQDHLTLCPQCLQTVLDLDSFPNLPNPGPEERLSSDEIATEWQRFRGRARLARFSGGKREFGTLPWGVAAALLTVVLGLGVQMARLQRQVEDLSKPRGGVALVDLFPVDGRMERAEGETEGIQALPWADRLVLILNLADVRSFPEYEVEIAEADGHEVWRGGGLRRTLEGTLPLEVPRRFLPAGSYRIRLFAVSPQGRMPVAEYFLLVRD